MKEASSQEWDFFWKKRSQWGIKSWLPRFQQYLLRKYIDPCLINAAKEFTKKGKVVEVGSGIGLDSILLAKERGDKVILVDFSRESLRQAKKIAQKYGVVIKLINADIRKRLPLGNKTATLAWNVGTIEHFRNPVEIVQEMKRISKCVICFVPMEHPLRTVYERFKRMFGLSLEGYFKLYTPEEMRRIFKAAGFKRVRVKRYTYFAGIVSFCGAIGLD